MAGPGDELSEAFHGVLDELRTVEARMAAHPALADPQSRAEVTRWLFSILQVGVQCNVWADPDRPGFVDIVGPRLKWGGDNSDAFYQHAAVRPGRRYRVTGERGDAVYLSLTVYGGPDDGHYSTRIVGSVNDRDLTFDDRGRFSFWIGPEPEDGPGIVLADDAVVAITRDYLAEPRTQRRTSWCIERVDDLGPFHDDTERLVAGLVATRTWLADQAAMVPVVLPEPNHVQPPYPVPTETFGWAAGDAAYAMGRFDVEPGRALVLRGRSPACAFWNMCLWNPLLHTFDADGPPVTINGTRVAAEADGSWTIVIADEPTGHPNQAWTLGHRTGLVWFRWFLPDATPGDITAEEVAVADVPAVP